MARDAGRIMKACHRCQKPWDEPGQPGFNNTCSGCGMSLHSCQNCLHHVTSGSVRCLVETAPPVQDPSAGNRCQHFEFSAQMAAEQQMATQEFTPSRTADPVADPASARRRWDKLFGGE